MARVVVGIDVGGTFTDFAILADGVVSVHKVPSTPQDQSQGIVQGLREAGIDGPDVSYVHGSTVATNSVLEGKGAHAALVTTQGFENVLLLGGVEEVRLPPARPPSR